MKTKGPVQLLNLLTCCFAQPKPSSGHDSTAEASDASKAQSDAQYVRHGGQVDARDAQQEQRRVRTNFSALQDASDSTQTRAPAYTRGMCTVDELLAWHMPCLVCALSSLKRYAHTPQLQPGSFVDILLPSSNDGRHLRSVRAHPVWANEPVAQCWALSVLTSASEVLQQLVRADDGLMHALSEAAATAVSLQPSLSSGGNSQARAVGQVYLCPPSLVARCGTRIRITTTYLHDPEDGSLMPALVLELEGLAIEQSYLPTSQAQLPHKAWPCTVEALAQLPPLAPSLGSFRRRRTDGSGKSQLVRSRHNRVQAKQQAKSTARSKAMLSSIPVTATLMQLDLQAQISHDTRSGPTSLHGHVLMQNQMSVEYWGRLTHVKVDNSVSWSVLVQLLGLDDVGSAVQHLQAVAQRVPPQQWLHHGWKKVVQVPGSCRSLGRRLREEQRQLFETEQRLQQELERQRQAQQRQQQERQRQEVLWEQEEQRRIEELESQRAQQRQLFAARLKRPSQSRLSNTNADSTGGGSPGASGAEWAWQGAGAGKAQGAARTAPWVRSIVEEGRRGNSLDEGSRAFVSNSRSAKASPAKQSVSTGQSRQHVKLQRLVQPLGVRPSSGAGSSLTRSPGRQYLRSMHSFSCGENEKMRQQLLATLAGPPKPSLKATMDAGLSVQPSNRVLSLLATMDSVRSTPSGEDNAMLVKQARTGSTTQLLPLEQARGSHPVLSGEGLRVPYVRSTSERAGARLLAALAELQGGQAAAEQEGVGSGSSTLMRVQDSSTLERIRESTMEMRSSLPAFVSPTNAKRRMSMLRESYRTAESHSEQLHRTPTDPPPAAATPRALQRRLASMEAADGDAAPMVSGLTHSVTAASLKGTIDSLRGTNESEYGSCCNNLASSSGVGLDSELAMLLGSSNSTREGEELSDDEPGEGEQAGQGQEGSEVWHEVQLLLVKDPTTDADAVMLLQTDITARALVERRMAALTEAQLSMLENMFPRHVLEYLCSSSTHGSAGVGALACKHDEVSILFLDIVGFTNMCKSVAPDDVMEFINLLFGRFDELCLQYNSYKLDTAGDAYIACAALMTVDREGFITIDDDRDPREGAASLVEYAQAMLRHSRTVTMPNGQPTVVRIGIHTGSVVSGVTGTKLLKFSLYGDTMNTSSRMESTCKPGCIQISESTYALLENGHQMLFRPTGGVEVKGKGLTATYMYSPEEAELQLRPEDLHVIQEGNESQEILLAAQSRTTHLLGCSDTHLLGTSTTLASNAERTTSSSHWATTQGPLGHSGLGASSSKSSLGLSAAASTLLPPGSFDRNAATAAAAAAAATPRGLRSSAAAGFPRFEQAMEDSQPHNSGRPSKPSPTGRTGGAVYGDMYRSSFGSAAADWGQAVNSWPVAGVLPSGGVSGSGGGGAPGHGAGSTLAAGADASAVVVSPVQRGSDNSDTSLPAPFARSQSTVAHRHMLGGDAPTSSYPAAPAAPERRATQDLGHLSYARRFSALTAAAVEGSRRRAAAALPIGSPPRAGMVAQLALLHKSASVLGAREGTSPAVSAATNFDMLASGVGGMYSSGANLMPGMGFGGPAMQGSALADAGGSTGGGRSTRSSTLPRHLDLQGRSSVVIMQQILHLVGTVQEEPASPPPA